ncbi:MAG: putative Fe-S protein [Planctomycetota bacterium]|nr:MAG: putative Fe-S protein [Planctomycetota bacterium]
MPNNDVQVSRITVYPVKSLDGVDVPQADVLPSGALAFDRQLAAEFDLDTVEITIRIRGQSATTFSLTQQTAELSRWLSEFFGSEIQLIENMDVGHPDDLQAPGPTILGTGSLQEVASWFGWPITQTRRRFRANIEVVTATPFWEDRCFGSPEQPIQFRMGSVVFEGSNPCARCAVPSRDPDTGEVFPRFAAEFAKRREATLPSWAERSRFDHFYRLSVNTRPDSSGGRIAVGDVVEIL